jgi:hypothetical protein
MAQPHPYSAFITREDLNLVSSTLSNEIGQVRDILADLKDLLGNRGTPTSVAITISPTNNLFDNYPNEILSNDLISSIQGLLNEHNLAKLSMLHFKELDSVRFDLFIFSLTDMISGQSDAFLFY